MLRTCLLSLLAIVASSGTLNAQAPPALSESSNGALELKVEHEHPEPGFGANDRYGILTITLKNISSEPLKIIVGSPYCDFAVDIWDSAGNPPKATALGKTLPKSDAERAVCPVLSAGIFELQPGKDYSRHLNINKLFELEFGRSYRIKVRWVKGLPAATPSGRSLRRELSQTLIVQ